jgi:hypothetical protein
LCFIGFGKLLRATRVPKTLKTDAFDNAAVSNV